MNEYYRNKLEQGLSYQDFVVEKLYEIGLPIISYSSKKYQHTVGENKCGFEIKFDDKVKSTGNLYIEIAEKSDPANFKYVDSGIYRNDNTWLYIIGNYEKIFIFPKKYLKTLYGRKKYKEVQTPTSRGFLIPAEKAEELSIKTITINSS
ncbi:MAG: hypothetical protein PHO15_03590 [Eubacteriales bacterium]|nr:hypothetical protein [Eubacteriales bacterium]